MFRVRSFADRHFYIIWYVGLSVFILGMALIINGFTD